MSNLKFVITGMFIYSSDCDDTAPPFYSFDGPMKHAEFIQATTPYIKNKDAFLCPQEQLNLKESANTGSQEGLPRKMDYVHCLGIIAIIPGYAKGNRSLKLNEVKDQANTPYLRDPLRGGDKDSFQSPHGDWFATAFLDGHVKSRSHLSLATEL